MVLNVGDKIHIDGSQISADGWGIVQEICKVSVTVKFLDTGGIGIYSFDRNWISLKGK